MFSKKDIEIINKLTWTDFKLRYSSSILGFLWSLLNPLLMLTVLYIVFSVLMKSEIEHYPIYLLIGIILWNYFYDSTLNGMSSIINKSDLIKKIYFKREIIIISSCLTSFISLILNLIVLLIFIIIFKVKLNFLFFYFIPLLIILFLISLGLSFFLSSLYSKFRDLHHIWQVLLQIGFFITPIFYPLSIIPEKILRVYLLNPLTLIINQSRDVLIFNKNININNLIYLTFFSLTLLLLGYYIFKLREKKFPEEI
ncbi:MAG: ABC transporter permease [Candidatus Pacearchaeota archaeon]